MNDSTTLFIIFLTISIVIVIAVVGVITGNTFINEYTTELTYQNCCNGAFCTDTYYTQEDNLCHYHLCEQSLFTNKAICVYEGKNITLNITNEEGAF